MCYSIYIVVGFIFFLYFQYALLRKIEIYWYISNRFTFHGLKDLIRVQKPPILLPSDVCTSQNQSDTKHNPFGTLGEQRRLRPMFWRMHGFTILIAPFRKSVSSKRISFLVLGPNCRWKFLALFHIHWRKSRSLVFQVYNHCISMVRLGFVSF